MSDNRPPSSALGKTRVASNPALKASRANKRTVGEASLLAIVGPKMGQQTKLSDETSLELGRDPKCDFPVDDDLVSRRHAKIDWDGASHRVTDLGSTNGTFVNDQRIDVRALVDGDRVSIGKAILKYLSSDNIEAEFHREVFHLMAHDGLTGIHNKRHFDDAMATETSKAYEPPQPLSVIVFDIDHFKKINDTHGHAAGDAVLRKLTQVVSTVVPPECLFARVGGEEFSIICPGHDLTKVGELAENVRANIEATNFEFGDIVIPVTASVGGATRPPRSTQGASDLYKAADEQLYLGKKGGRNRVCVSASV